MLVTIAPALLAPILVPERAVALGLPASSVGALSALLVLIGAARFGERWARFVATSGLVLAYIGWATAHPDKPQGGLVFLLAVVALGAGIWPARSGESVWRSLAPVPAASVVALALVLLGWTAVPIGPGGDIALAAAAVVPAAIAYERGTGRFERQLASAAMLLPVTYTMLRLAELIGPRAAVVVGIGPAFLLSRTVPPAAVWQPVWRLLLDVVVTSPPRLVVLSFVALSAVGTLFLALPVSDAQGRGLALVDAAFMAVSATTVTGLATVDPAAGFSVFGRGVLLVLMQVGAIGIMTFASGAALLGGRTPRFRAGSALRQVLLVTVAVEGAAALLLLPALLNRGHGLARSVAEAVYVGVSAFCNGGLVPWRDGLRDYQQAPWILLVVGVTVLLGSLGPSVLAALPALAQGRKVPLYVRLSLVTTAALLVVPLPLVLGFEWSNTLAHLPWADRLAVAWAMVASARTAAFEAVPTADIDPGTWTVLVPLMFVGGASGSTAGGIRVTTFAVLVLAGIATIRGRRSPEYAYRQIPHRAVYESLAITCAGITAAIGGLLLLQITQKLPLEAALFEVVSALGTAGLSMGATTQVDALGKCILIGCMLAGRVGPLTLILFLSEREREPPPTAYPVEEVLVG